MRLTLSRNCPTNTVLSNEAGQIIYKIETPSKFLGRTSTITRIVPNDITGNDEYHMKDRFAHLAQIEWRMFGSSRVRFGGSEVDVQSYFRKVGFGWYGRHRAFVAPDGREYKWRLGANVPELTLNDGSNTPIAKFHRRHLGIFHKARKASLEVFPAGEHIIDAIVVTFVYIEELRRVKERAAKKM